MLCFSSTLSSYDRLNIYFELFLIPDDRSEGNLELLLSNIINPDHQIIFECFERYQECLENNPEYRVPALKTKIYAYQETLLSENEIKMAKEENRNYLNNEHWKLDTEYLNPLKNFLSSYL